MPNNWSKIIAANGMPTINIIVNKTLSQNIRVITTNFIVIYQFSILKPIDSLMASKTGFCSMIIIVLVYWNKKVTANTINNHMVISTITTSLLISYTNILLRIFRNTTILNIKTIPSNFAI